MITHWKTLLAIVISAIIITASLVAIQNNASKLSPVCQSLVASGFKLQPESGFTYICGNMTASDGRLSIIVHKYRFAQAQNISFENSPNEPKPAPQDVFAIVNTTVVNVGPGNFTLGGGFLAQIAGNTFPPVQNTDFSINATFPGTYPNQTLPNINGGIYMPPGRRADFWLLFFVPNATSTIMPSLSLQYFGYRELRYGGNYIGGGGFSCIAGTCQTTLTEFIIAVKQ